MNKKTYNINNIEKNVKSKKYKNLYKILNEKERKFLYNFVRIYDEKIKNGKSIRYQSKNYSFIYYSELGAKAKVCKNINILVSLNLIEKLNITKDRRIRELSSIHRTIKLAKTNRELHKYYSEVQYFYVPKYSINLLKKSNKIAQQLIAKGYSKSNFCQAFLALSLGVEEAQKVYINKKTYNYMYELKEKMKKYINRELQIHNFINQKIMKKNLENQFKIKYKLLLIIYKNIILEEKEQRNISVRRMSSKEKEIYNINKNNMENYIFKGENYEK